MNHPQKQNAGIQEIDEENHEADKIYLIKNYGGTVYVDSHNTRTVTMENCGNQGRQVQNCLSSLFSS